MRRYIVLFITVGSLFLDSAEDGMAQVIRLDLGKGLTIGDEAPKLAVQEFVRGDAVKQFEKGKVYVVEFWKCGCPPCRAAIPHLTELQKKYPDVVVISVGVITPTRDNKEFVKKMGEKMGYRVAVDAVPEGKNAEEGGAMLEGWLRAAGLHGVPEAFIVDGNGKIAWIGHPTAMDEPLKKIRSGQWDDLQAVAARYARFRSPYNAVFGETARHEVAKLPKAEQAAVWAIQKSAGKVIFVVNHDSVYSVCFSPSGAAVTDAKLKDLVKQLKKLKGLQELELTNTEVTDAGLKEIRELKMLQILLLGGAQVTDVGLKELRRLENLRWLALNRCRKVTDAGLKELQGLHLESLSLAGTQVTDAGLKSLQSSDELEKLDLGDTQVTDAGLKELKELRNLKILRLAGARVTNNGVDELKKYLKELRVGR